MTPSLSMQGVSKARGRGSHRVDALRGASLDLAPGEVVLLEGPSGSGKTTLLLVAAGLLSPDEGSVHLAGHDLAPMTPAARRALRTRRVGFVFQRSNLLDSLDVRDNVCLAAALAGMSRSESRDATDRLLAALGIASIAGRRPDSLSGGEEHRVAVARALVHRPCVVLADEPTGSLDGVSGSAVAQALVDIATESGVAVLIATHDIRLRPLATRHLALTDGVLGPNLRPRSPQ